MKKLLFFLTVMCLSLPFADAQAPLARHYWLPSESVNYTLSPPTTNGEWIVAAARTEIKNGFITGKNTIAVFRLNDEYEILSSLGKCDGEVSVIGYPGTGTDTFNRYINFEVHDVVQSCNPDDHYIICGSVRKNADQGYIGMVVVLNANLTPISIREYPNAEVFYSVYAQGGYYYVCGKMRDGKGVVMQDNIASTPYPRAWTTQNNWVFHKIKVRQRPCSEEFYEFSVSGWGIDNLGRQVMGFCIFELPYPPFWNLILVTSRQFLPKYPVNPNSKVVLGNYPGLGGMSRGLILSASSGQEIHTYLFQNHLPVDPYPSMTSAFRIFTWSDNRFVLEDMDCGQNPNRIAWVGNWMHADDQVQQRATYIRMNSPFPSPPAVVNFTPYNNPPSAYYSLHKVHFYKDQPDPDFQFHAGGFYHHVSYPNDPFGYNYYRMTFVVTPDDVPVSTPDERGCALPDPKYYEVIDTSQVEKLWIDSDITPVDTIAPMGLRLGFCVTDCQGTKRDDCGFRIIDITKKRKK